MIWNDVSILIKLTGTNGLIIIKDTWDGMWKSQPRRMVVLVVPVDWGLKKIDFFVHLHRAKFYGALKWALSLCQEMNKADIK